MKVSMLHGATILTATYSPQINPQKWIIHDCIIIFLIYLELFS